MEYNFKHISNRHLENLKEILNIVIWFYPQLIIISSAQNS